MKLIDIFDPKYRKYFNEPKKELISEGLILTHPMTKSIKIIESNGFDVVLVDDDRYRNRFFVEITDLSDSDKLFKIANNLGWFCSQIRGAGKYGADDVKYTATNLRRYFEKYDELMLLFEPKYDIEVSLVGIEYLYHFTTKINWHRIKKHGLTPRTSSKTATHPERVYLTFSVSDAEKLSKKIANRRVVDPDPKHKYSGDVDSAVILRIHVDSLPDGFRLFSDPNFLNKGGFTLNSIRPSAITLFKEL